MMKKILVQIDSHANTSDKIELTKLCIESLRPLGFPILVTSHIEISDEIKKLADYTYSDGINVLLPDTDDIYYYYYSTDSFVMSFLIKNIEPHSPAAVSALQNGAKFAIENGFDYFLKVEYDLILENFEINRLLEHIHSGQKKLGFFYGPNNKDHLAPKCIFLKSHLVSDLLREKITNSDIYYQYCNYFNVPSNENRITGNFQYHLFRNYIDLFDRYYWNGDDYFKYNVPKNLQTNFAGFFCPLVSNRGDIFLSACGLSHYKTTYNLLENGLIMKSADLQLEEGSWYFENINFKDDANYKLTWGNTQISFTKQDILEKKFGSINFF